MLVKNWWMHLLQRSVETSFSYYLVILLSPPALIASQFLFYQSEIFKVTVSSFIQWFFSAQMIEMSIFSPEVSSVNYNRCLRWIHNLLQFNLSCQFFLSPNELCLQPSLPPSQQRHWNQQNFLLWYKSNFFNYLHCADGMALVSSDEKGSLGKKIFWRQISFQNNILDSPLRLFWARTFVWDIQPQQPGHLPMYNPRLEIWKMFW